jgi:mycolipenoyl-CoA---2-(long-chain-fatty acyl)-trehalose mycolipenoyltransferase / long-chain-acyl-CoA---trehalose acyltransferase
MRLTAADVWNPEPGHILTWQAKADGFGVPAPLSLNQITHLDAAAAGAPPLWLAAVFDAEGPIDVDALQRALHDLVARHSSLQIEAVLGDGGVTARRHRPSTLRWSSVTGPETTSAGETGELVRELLAEGCHPFGYPAFAPIAISRPDRSTIVFGMDHLHCDAYSVAVVVDELAALYDGHRLGLPVTLGDPGSFVAAIEAELEEPVRLWPDDDRLREWHEFLRRRDHALPTFPLDLGVAPGADAPQATLVTQLLDAETTTMLSLRARQAGSTAYAASLVALAAALHDLGGPDRLDTLAPISMRSDDASRRAVGWYTAQVPLSLPAGTDEASLAEAGRAVRRALSLAQVPLSEVTETLSTPLVHLRNDVFMVSWMDYRRLPGAALARSRNAHHVSAPTRADDLQLWLARTDDGLDLRVRMPDTETARRVVEEVVALWTLRLREIAGLVRRARPV